MNIYLQTPNRTKIKVYESSLYHNGDSHPMPLPRVGEYVKYRCYNSHEKTSFWKDFPTIFIEGRVTDVAHIADDSGYVHIELELDL